MGILSGPEIYRQVCLGNIKIEPFDKNRLGPNSYDVCLGDTLFLVHDNEFDISKKVQDVQEFKIPREGIRLDVGVGYLGHTIETITCNGFVPWLDGRSTLGRYFLQLHQTAGRADDGFSGTLTLELLATYRPVRVYAGMPIAQISFFTLEGERQPYKGRYQNQTGPKLPQPIPKPFYPETKPDGKKNLSSR